MCGRYHLTDDPANERVRQLYEVAQKRYQKDPRLQAVKQGMVYPSDLVPIIGEDEGVYLSWWGFPGFKGSDLIINARSETLPEKKTFATPFLKGRCLVPASGFYEWDRADKDDKRPYLFEVTSTPIFYMAGIITPGLRDNVPKRFQVLEEKAEKEGAKPLPFMAIVTTEGNESIADIHHRMPLILDTDQAKAWLHSESDARALLKTPCKTELLKHR